jgi:hypothetical protein
MSKASSEAIRTIQYLKTFKSEKEADEAVLALVQLDGCIAARTLRHTPQKPGWRAQAFFADNSKTLDLLGKSSSADLPDNCQRVLLLPNFLTQLCKRG